MKRTPFTYLQINSYGSFEVYQHTEVKGTQLISGGECLQDVLMAASNELGAPLKLVLEIL